MGIVCPWLFLCRLILNIAALDTNRTKSFFLEVFFMAAISGSAGDITIGGTAVKVKSWNMNLMQEEIDITDKADAGWKAMAVGLKQAEGSFEFDMDTGLHDTGTFPFPFDTSSAAFVLSMSDGTNDGGSFSFTGFVFNCDFSSPVEGVISVSGSYKSSGAVTYTP